MDSATLRWIIIIIGLAILATIFLFGNPSKKRPPKASRRKVQSEKVRREPTLEPAVDATPDMNVDDETGQGQLPIVDTPANTEQQAEPKPKKRRKPAGPPPDKIITLFLMARDNHVIAGADLLEAALKTGMTFGDMNIFHRTVKGIDQPAFSMANALKPGFFDKDAWNTFETGGVALFLTLPGPTLALDGWDAMLATARRMAEILQAELHDGDHEPFTRQKEAELREEMRLYDRSKARQTFT
ncbi:MAG TPA: cell division protein ZipA [Xanthomonadales bacterium]|nr:cell division protein ZipA [Xanthomonadales bacterium]